MARLHCCDYNLGERGLLSGERMSFLTSPMSLLGQNVSCEYINDLLLADCE